MIRPALRACAPLGRRITTTPYSKNDLRVLGIWRRGGSLGQQWRYDSSTSAKPQTKPTSKIDEITLPEATTIPDPPSFTPHPVPSPSTELPPPNGTNHTTTSADSIPIPSMPPPPAPIPPRKPSSPLPDLKVVERKEGGMRMVRKKDWKAMFLEPVYGPLRAYGAVHKRRPLMTQFISALVIYFVGDMVAQGIGGDALKGGKEEKEGIEGDEGKEGVVEKGPLAGDERSGIVKWAEDRDWWRTGRALIIGGVAAVPGFKWFVWLSNSFNYSSKVGSLCVKVLVNQTLFTPVFNTYFFGMQSLLTAFTPAAPSPSNPHGNTPHLISFTELYEHISNTVPRSCYNSCKIWPAVTAFSFAFVKLEYRSLVAGVVAIGWQTYLSLLDSRVRRGERERHEREAQEKEAERGIVKREVRDVPIGRELETEGREKIAV